ncbi:MAG: O-antigen ligase family protein [Dinoroseobacter sp.]|nr:O-antigen ligase family protein [Dinoroseobacter sp.]
MASHVGVGSPGSLSLERFGAANAQTRISWHGALSIVVLSGAFFEQIIFGTTYLNISVPSPTLVNGIIYVPIYLGAIVVILRMQGSQRTNAVRSFFPFLLISLFGLASIFWAIRPSLSLVDATQTLLTVAIAAALASSIQPQDLSKTLSRTFIVLLGASLVYTFLIPTLGTMSLRGENSSLNGLPQGVFAHKNRYGEVASIGACIALTVGAVVPLRERILLLVVSGAGLALSDSAAKTGAFLCAIAIYVLWVFFFRRTASLRASFFLICVAVIVLGLLVAPYLAGLIQDAFNKTSTLSGRTLIWEHARLLILERPVLGYGMNSVWGTSLGNVEGIYYWDVPHSHNLAIEVLLRSGFVGLLLMLWCILKWVSVLINTSPSIPLASLFFLLMIMSLIRSPFEFVLFRENQVGYLILLTVFGSVMNQKLLSERNGHFLNHKLAA